MEPVPLSPQRCSLSQVYCSSQVKGPRIGPVLSPVLPPQTGRPAWTGSGIWLSLWERAAFPLCHSELQEVDDVLVSQLLPGEKPRPWKQGGSGNGTGKVKPLGGRCLSAGFRTCWQSRCRVTSQRCSDRSCCVFTCGRVLWHRVQVVIEPEEYKCVCPDQDQWQIRQRF